MKERKMPQSEYMSLQLMEIENFRLSLCNRGHEKITLQEAIMLWISEGHADTFRQEFNLTKSRPEPATA